MAVDAGLTALAEELFAPLGPITIRRMFGGAGVFTDGVMFALIAEDCIYLKTDADHAAALAAEGGAQFTYLKQGKPFHLGYWTLPDAAMDDPEEACRWAAPSLAFARISRNK